MWNESRKLERSRWKTSTSSERINLRSCIDGTNNAITEISRPFIGWKRRTVYKTKGLPRTGWCESKPKARQVWKNAFKTLCVPEADPGGALAAARFDTPFWFCTRKNFSSDQCVRQKPCFQPAVGPENFDTLWCQKVKNVQKVKSREGSCL